MNYKSTIKMRRSLYEQVNRLLEIDSLSDMTEEEMKEIGAETDVNELLYSADFINGVKLNVYLCSGNENYYTAPEFALPDGRLCCPEDMAGFDLSQKEEYTLNNDSYVVNIELTDDVEEWVILSEDSDGKIHFFHRMTDNEQDFIRDVRALPQAMNILAVYLQKDVVEGASGTELKV